MALSGNMLLQAPECFVILKARIDMRQNLGRFPAVCSEIDCPDPQTEYGGHRNRHASKPPLALLESGSWFNGFAPIALLTRFHLRVNNLTRALIHHAAHPFTP